MKFIKDLYCKTEAIKAKLDGWCKAAEKVDVESLEGLLADRTAREVLEDFVRHNVEAVPPASAAEELRFQSRLQLAEG